MVRLILQHLHQLQQNFGKLRIWELINLSHSKLAHHQVAKSDIQQFQCIQLLSRFFVSNIIFVTTDESQIYLAIMWEFFPLSQQFVCFFDCCWLCPIDSHEELWQQSGTTYTEIP